MPHRSSRHSSRHSLHSVQTEELDSAPAADTHHQEAPLLVEGPLAAMFPGLKAKDFPPKFRGGAEDGRVHHDASDMDCAPLRCGLALEMAPRDLKQIVLPCNEFTGEFSGFSNLPPQLDTLLLRSSSLNSAAGIRCSALPRHLCYLGLSFNAGIKGDIDFSDLPRGLVGLELEGMPGLTGTISSFSVFPDTLQKLNLCGCTGIKSSGPSLTLRELPKAMEEALFSGCSNLAGCLLPSDWNAMSERCQNLVWLHLDGTSFATCPPPEEMTKRTDWSYKSNDTEAEKNKQPFCPCCVVQ